MSILPILRGIRSFAGIQLTLAEAFAFFFYWLTINKIRGNIIDASFSTPNRTEARISYPAAGEIGLSNQKMLVTFDPSTISRSDVPLSRQKKTGKTRRQRRRRHFAGPFVSSVSSIFTRPPFRFVTGIQRVGFNTPHSTLIDPITARFAVESPKSRTAIQP